MHGPIGILPLRAVDLTYKVHGRTLINTMNFAFEPMRRTMILGPNGSGKTLTLKLCHGIIEPSSGTLEWRRGGATDVRRRQAMVFQQPVLLRRSIRANIRYALAVNGWSRQARGKRAANALERFGLTAIADQPARSASGGEKQRVALARAWALRPEVIFLDEPTAALDPSATKTVEELVRSFADEGATVVMSTHDLGQARRLADDVLFLHRGTLLEHGAATEFFASPRTPEAQAFLRGDLLW